MASEDQLKAALIKADKSGDAASAKVIALELRKLGYGKKPMDADAFDASVQGDIRRSVTEGVKQSLPGVAVRGIVRAGADAIHRPQPERVPYEPTTGAGRVARGVSSIAPDLAIPMGGEVSLPAKAPALLKLLSGVTQTGIKSAGMSTAGSMAGQYADKGEVDPAKVGEAAKSGAEFGAGARTLTGALRLPREVAKKSQESRDPAYTENVVDRLKEVGIPLRPAQEAGTDRAQKMENFFNWIAGPKKHESIVREQEGKVNELVNREMGLTGGKVKQREVVLQKDRLGRELGGIYDRGWVAPQRFAQGQNPVTAPEPVHLPADLKKRVDDAFQHGMSGEDYQRLRAELREHADANVGTPDTPRWYWQARNALDRSFLPASNADEVALRRARYQYSNVKNVLALEKAGGIVDNNADLPTLGEVSKRPGWHEHTPEQRPVYVYYGEAAKDAGLHPLRWEEVPKAGKNKDIHGFYETLSALTSSVGVPSAGLLLGHFAGAPAVGLGSALALRPAVRGTWYGAKVQPWLSTAAQRATTAIPAQEAIDEEP